MQKRMDEVLLADDDRSVQLMLKHGLELRGFRVRTVSSGQELLTAVEQEAPDIVVIDGLMPGMDGFETCRQLRLLPGTAGLPVLMLTSLSDEPSISRAYAAGASDFIVKSPQITLLAERLRYMLQASRAQEALRRSEERLTKAQRIARFGHWEWPLDHGMISSSDECRNILGRTASQSQLPADEFAAALAGMDPCELRDRIMDQIRVHGIFRGEFAIKLSDGGQRHVQVEAQLNEADRNTGPSLHGTIQDVSERRAAEAHLQRLANFDGLTGLPNRHQFRERLAVALERARARDARLAVLFIDLDRFKVINDTLGHSKGDLLLREVAARLGNCVRGGRRGGTGNVARLGGDEFTILLTDLRDKADATHVAARVVSALQQPFDLHGQDFWVSASVGIAISPDDGADAETLLMHADAAMYQVKAQGRNGHVHYTPAFDARGLERFKLESDLRRALSRNELRLYYQPIVNVADGKIVGAEALMRWQRGEKLESPAEFIPIAEDTGLIVPMSEWAIQEACRQVAEWKRAFQRAFYVAVNISGRHFQQPNLLDAVTHSLASAGLDASALQLEITETIAMHTVETTQRTLARARELGLRLAIDDFGTGYSSLAYLKRLPIDTLKIDRSFVKDIARHADDEAIVSAIIGLARSLRLSVVAEGVETPTQIAFLSMFGATLMQGFHFAKPLPPAEFAALLERNGQDSTAWRSPDRSQVLHLFDEAQRRGRALPLAPAPAPALREAGLG